MLLTNSFCSEEDRHCRVREDEEEDTSDRRVLGLDWTQESMLPKWKEVLRTAWIPDNVMDMGNGMRLTLYSSRYDVPQVTLNE